MKKLRFVLVVGLVFACSGYVFTQATATGTIQGTVVDKSQAVVVGADVVATNNGTGAVRSIATNTAGLYRFELLPAGNYTVKVTKAGFATSVQKLDLLVGQTATANAVLSPGAASEVVEVTGTAVLVDQEKTSVSQNIVPQEVQEMPLLGRDVASLAYLAPGVKQADSFDPTKNRSAVLSVNGSSGRNVNVTVNGIDNKDSTVGGTVMQLPLEAVQEYQISTQRFSAANGRSEGAAINMITKSGTNNYHGSLFGYFRDQALNVTDFQSEQNGVKPPYSRQWFGGSIGGPVKKDKAFLFFAYERQREETSLPEDPNDLIQLEAVKAANHPLLVVEPSAVIPTPFYENRYNGRFDYKFSDRESAYISYTSQANNSLNDQSDGTGDLTFGNFTTNHLQVANLTMNSVLSNSLVNNFTFGFQYWNNLIDSDIRAPYYTFPSGAKFGTNLNVPQQSFQRKWQWRDDLIKTAGKHTLKMGVDYVWEPRSGGFFESNSTLELDFSKDPTVIATLPAGWATPGLVSAMLASNGDPTFIATLHQLGLYFQDDWKVSKRLSVNLGLRWDKDFNLVGASFVTKSKTFLEMKAIGSPYGTLTPHDDNKDFSPRVGFAYDLTGQGKHLLRGGFGLYYGNIFQNLPLFMEQQANPTVYQQLFNVTSATDIVPGTGIQLQRWRFGIDPMPVIPPPSSVLNPGSTGRLMDPSYRNPYSEQFNVGYQWAVDPVSVIEAEYVHELGLHENKTVNLNPLVNGVRPYTAAFTAAGVPVLGAIRDEQSINRSRYDGLNISYRRRMSNHFSLSANYTLSRAMGWSVESGFNGSATGATSSNYHNYSHNALNQWLPSDFGPTPQDERHHVTLSGIVQLPWGFQVAPILQFGSARPYDLNEGYDVLGFGSSYTRPLVVQNSAPTNYLAFASSSQAAAAQSCLAAGQCHVVNYDSVRGDPFFQLDTRFSKNIKLGENRNLELMFQAFNLTNKTNFGNDFVNTATSGAKLMTPGGYINPSSTQIPRAFVGEFGFRFSF